MYTASLQLAPPWLYTSHGLWVEGKLGKTNTGPYVSTFVRHKLPSMSNHGVNGNAQQLSFGTQLFRIFHPHSLLFRLLSEIANSHVPLRNSDNPSKQLQRRVLFATDSGCAKNLLNYRFFMFPTLSRMTYNWHILFVSTLNIDEHLSCITITEFYLYGYLIGLWACGGHHHPVWGNWTIQMHKSMK